MTTIPQMECCTMLGIDPKTLRNWLRHAHLHFVAHPTDARLKCLTSEQVQQLAALHARPLQSPAAASAALRQEASPLASTLSPPVPTQASETPLACATPSFTEEAELRKAVSALEAQVMTLQEQVAQLTLELLRERSERYERRLSSLEALLSQSTPLLPVKAEERPVVAPHREHPFQRTLQPGELRARSRVLPRVEMGAAGSYVLICPARWGAGFRPRFAGMVRVALLSFLVPLCWSCWPFYRLSRGTAQLESLSHLSWAELQTVSWHHRSSDSGLAWKKSLGCCKLA